MREYRGHRLFFALAQHIATALDVWGCDIYTYDRRSDALTTVAVWAREMEPRDVARVGTTHTLSAHDDFAATIERSALVERHDDDPLLTPGTRKAMSAWGSRAVLSVPLTLDGEAVGLLTIIEKRSARRFTAAERSLVHAFANAAAMAIRAETLYEQLREQNTHLAEELEQRDRLADELSQLSLRDELTGLYNRRGFTTLAEQELKLARRINRHCALVFADIDSMKYLNDTWGHAAGDDALRATAGFLRATFREADVAARLGGDEFAVLMVEYSEAAPQLVPERLTSAIRVWREHSREAWASDYELSVGVAQCERIGTCSIEELLERADLDMYEEKRRHRPRSRHSA